MRYVFAVWLALTTVHQFPIARRFTARIDPHLLFLPIWTFFGPFPGTTDAEIAYRTVRAGGSIDAWKHLNVYEQRRLGHFLIHRNRRLEKTVFDALGQIDRLLSTDIPRDRIMASPPYITILSVVLALAHVPADAEKIQFMLVQSDGNGKGPMGTVPLFASAFHNLANQKALI